MSSKFFNIADGDVILRAGQEPGSRHDFCVHKVTLSITSPVFKDMFASPQPSTQNNIEQSTFPIIDVPYSPEAVDVYLRFSYVKSPSVIDFQTLTALFPLARAYKVSSLWLVLRATLKSFLPDDPFGCTLWRAEMDSRGRRKKLL